MSGRRLSIFWVFPLLTPRDARQYQMLVVIPRSTCHEFAARSSFTFTPECVFNGPSLFFFSVDISCLAYILLCIASRTRDELPRLPYYCSRNHFFSFFRHSYRIYFGLGICRLPDLFLLTSKNISFSTCEPQSCRLYNLNMPSVPMDVKSTSGMCLTSLPRDLLYNGSADVHIQYATSWAANAWHQPK